MGVAAEVGSNLLLFALVFGMSATVDIKDIKRQVGNRNALLTGVFLQFVVLPFLGFAVVKALNLSTAMGVTLLVVTSSPGGSYSNWWCSMFNADLALSVTMTAISTLLSIIMLPINLTIYTTFSYSGDVVKNLDWFSLFVSLVVVIGAIAGGLLCSAKVHSHKFNLFANKLGNVAGITLVVYSILVSGPDDSSSSGEGQGLWDRNWAFYCGVAAPCVLGLVIANLVTSFLNLAKPERVTTSVECCYQNVGIATSVAISMFEGDELSEAIGVPLFYGLVEAVVLGFYCVGAWKMGWTKAPKDEKICVVVMTSYEVEEAIVHDVEAIEVVLGVSGLDRKDGGSPGLPDDLVFSFDEENGYHVDRNREEGGGAQAMVMISHLLSGQDNDNSGRKLVDEESAKDAQSRDGAMPPILSMGSIRSGERGRSPILSLDSVDEKEPKVLDITVDEESATTSSCCPSPTSSDFSSARSSADNVRTGEDVDAERATPPSIPQQGSVTSEQGPGGNLELVLSPSGEDFQNEEAMETAASRPPLPPSVAGRPPLPPEASGERIRPSASFETAHNTQMLPPAPPPPPPPPGREGAISPLSIGTQPSAGGPEQVLSFETARTTATGTTTQQQPPPPPPPPPPSSVAAGDVSTQDRARGTSLISGSIESVDSADTKEALKTEEENVFPFNTECCDALDVLVMDRQGKTYKSQ